jgi:2-(1,2-epoxy-1,2-dihydrophenyl)acetyl-CoA isomerase
MVVGRSLVRESTAERQIIYETRNEVALITLNDPTTLNALSTPMLEELHATLTLAEKEARAIVLTGAGRGFCSGAKLGGEDFPAGAERDMGARLEKHTNPLMLLISNLSVPLITAVNGAAVGSGCSLALAGDLVIASEKAFFLQAFVRVGLVPDAGSTHMLALAIGRVRAMEMMLLGEKLGAAQAMEWGLVNRVVPDDHAVVAAMEIASRLAMGPGGALRMTRKLVWDALETPFEQQLAREREAQKRAGERPDFDEGVAAFREKRPANFGR